MEKPMNAELNQFPWGSHLVKMTIFFDNVFRIPASNQRGKFCIACRSQATFVKLDGDVEPLAFYCAEHDARRVEILFAICHFPVLPVIYAVQLAPTLC
jgi:hypothetical protein